MLSYPDFKYKQLAIHIAGGSGEIMRFRADNVIIEDKEKKVLLQHSCHKLFALFIIGEISLTSVMLKQAVAFAFPIILMNRNLHVITRINCIAEGNTLLREKQYTSTRNLAIAQQLIAQKIHNQCELLRTLRTPSQADLQTIRLLMDTSALYTTQDSYALMGLEGNASKAFFQSYFRPLHWIRREPRCKRDVYNLLLDIGYTYLFNFIEAFLALYGFDLYRGVLHTCFYQRKSLVCDLVEPFRCIIDRRIRKAYNLKQIHMEDFVFTHEHWQLSYKAQAHYTQLFLKDLLAEKEAIFRYCQAYYRWFIRDRPIAEFPYYSLTKEDHTCS